ncbi:hypothetical protein K0M31_004846 [Melipona bicolor]|uniref:Uncharacterized protein n=1 Tax=Melipona bicolor TaxID=60889 RepID=A0AA40FVM4_9HYME|nr:hypothetical protein K0M31_004846 [Melipona bicolor]
MDDVGDEPCVVNESIKDRRGSAKRWIGAAATETETEEQQSAGRRRDAVEDDDVREDRKRGGVHWQWLIAAGAMLATYKNARRRAFAAFYAIPNSKQQKRSVAAAPRRHLGSGT